LQAQKGQIHAANPAGQRINFSLNSFTFTLDGTGQKLISGSAFLRPFKPAFDSKSIAQNCVGKPNYKGLTAQEIQAQWKAKADRSGEEGTEVHAYADAVLKLDSRPEPSSERCERLFACVDSSIYFLKKNYKYLGSEVLIFSPALGVAMFVDVVMLDESDGSIVVLDWKQNEQIKIDNRWEKMLPPLAHLDNCNFNEYSLQLNLARVILDQERYYPEAPEIRLGIIHLQEFTPAINMKVEPQYKEILSIIKHNNAKHTEKF